MTSHIPTARVRLALSLGIVAVMAACSAAESSPAEGTMERGGCAAAACQGPSTGTRGVRSRLT
jgi:hypothetical protein